MVHSRRCAFPVSWAQAKKTRRGLNSLSYFHAHEKQSILAVAPFQFLGRKKNGPLDHFLIFVYEW